MTAATREWHVGESLWTLAIVFDASAERAVEKPYLAGVVDWARDGVIAVRLRCPEDFDGAELRMFSRNGTAIWHSKTEAEAWLALCETNLACERAARETLASAPHFGHSGGQMTAGDPMAPESTESTESTEETADVSE